MWGDGSNAFAVHDFQEHRRILRTSMAQHGALAEAGAPASLPTHEEPAAPAAASEPGPPPMPLPESGSMPTYLQSSALTRDELRAWQERLQNLEVLVASQSREIAALKAAAPVADALDVEAEPAPPAGAPDEYPAAGTVRALCLRWERRC